SRQAGSDAGERSVAWRIRPIVVIPLSPPSARPRAPSSGCRPCARQSITSRWRTPRARRSSGAAGWWCGADLRAYDAGGIPPGVSPSPGARPAAGWTWRRRPAASPTPGENAGMITLVVNGKQEAVDVSPDKPLLWVLRENLALTGPKYG